MADRITKTVDMSGEPVEIFMTKMMKPCTPEEYEAMSVEEREHAKIQPPMNRRVYSPEDGIICMQDVPVKMRDGVTIYADIYKPEEEGKYPLVISWSFYGKRPFDGQSEWQIMGVPPQTVSDMSKFESPDPGFWCRRGYAVANVDPRGIGHSEGDFVQFGTQDGKDGYDFIEWAAQQEWCNGRCALSGNSCVAMTQWRIASQCPPHLACIAPWESTTDMYRESLAEGGIPAHTFVRLVMQEACGPNYMDLFINVQKLSTDGTFLPITLFGEPHPGVWGKMRVSRRKLDEKLSTDYCPVQAHTCEEKLEPGQIVPVDIEIVPTSRFWHKGQQIRVQIAGRYIREDWFEPLTWDTDNKGRHIVYTGGRYESFLQIPVVPPRFQDGDIIIR